MNGDGLLIEEVVDDDAEETRRQEEVHTIPSRKTNTDLSVMIWTGEESCQE